ncbi:MAG: hypothetical protein H6708_22450 [Kofleriaceae bacterium]|nr:hypothetical protein [Kofleriaceae bacterium]
MRELQKQYQAMEKAEEKVRAEMEARGFETYLRLLVSVHSDCGPSWDWAGLANAPAPVPPPATTAHTDRAEAALADYQPGLLARVFGGATKRRTALQQECAQARATDARVTAEADREYQEAHALWAFRAGLAPRVLAQDPEAYRHALDHGAPFTELEAFKTSVRVLRIEPDVVVLHCELMDDELVPADEVKLTAAGKLTTKKMAIGRYWALYQDHVCSCALRAARETFAVLPVPRAIVHVATRMLNSSTGHHELSTLLSVHFHRAGLERLNFAALDASDSMSNFPHRMKFKKTKGFDPVEPIAVDEQWVTT